MTAERAPGTHRTAPEAVRTPQPPAHLQADGKAFWRKVLTQYEITDHHDLARLQLAAECLDRLAECRAAVTRDGAWVVGRFGPKPHPALLMEDRMRSQFARIVKDLGLGYEPVTHQEQTRAMREARWH